MHTHDTISDGGVAHSFNCSPCVCRYASYWRTCFC